MARKRRTPRKTGSDSKEQVTTEPVTAIQNTASTIASTTTERGKISMGLDPNQIKALLGKTRTKGQYVAALGEFIAGGQNGVCANDEWDEFEERKATTLKQGFDNAINHKDAPDGADQVKVISSDEKVYLLNMAVARSEGTVDEEADAA